MKKRYIFLIVIVVFAGLAYFYFARDTREIKVLVFSKTKLFRHESIPVGKRAIAGLGKVHGFSVDTTENAEVFAENKLRNYNVIIFLNTTGDVLNDAQQLEMNRWIQAGGGFVGVHAAADTEYEWPWYGELVGAYFNGHPNDPNVRDASIDRVDKNHISTQHLPERWNRMDEWYNFKSIRPEINVLLNLDESSYEGGTNGKSHPIAWFREFDGGRTWYTGLGHTIESYEDRDFLNHVWGGIQYAAGEGKPVDYNNARVAPEENRFQKVELDFNLNEPMELDILPNGNLLFIERHGNIKLFEKNTQRSRVITKLNVFSSLEDGLLGLAIDPDYSANHWIYLFYSPAGNEAVQRVSRFNFEGDSLIHSSEKILLTIPVQREQCCHAAGSLEFGTDRTLFIAVGDNTSPRETGYAPIDERAGRSAWDAQKSSSNTNDFRGKILRIKPENDGTYSIPEGNLFRDAKDGMPEIFVMGVRNPFRISIDQKTGYLYWGDVGPDAGKDSVGFGSKGYDEINQARSAGNFGWPYFIGNNFPYHKYDFNKNTSGPLFNASKPINTSPNNSGARELPEAHPAYIYYPYTPSKEYPLVGEGGRNAMAGPVFHLDNYPASDKRYPLYYNNKLFIYDWMRGWLMAVTMNAQGDFVRMERFLPNTLFNNLMDIIIGPDGDFYALEYGTNWFSQNIDARLIHITYSAANRVPIAIIKANRTIGKTPLTVQFSADSSIDYDGDALQYEWTFGDQDKKSSEKNPEFKFMAPGQYNVSLTVTDPSGKKGTSETIVIAGNDLPNISLKLQGNALFYWDNKSIRYDVEVSDSEDGTLHKGIDPASVTVTADYLARGHDVSQIVQGHQQNVQASAHLVGKALTEGSDCKACHHMDQKSVGPAYIEIAKKYAAADQKTRVHLVNKIIKGGSGVWGDLMMSPHPQLSYEEAEKMVGYILSLSGKKIYEGMPPSGNVLFNKHKSTETEGKYILTASYTDRGAKGVRPLTATAVISLRYSLIPADQFTEIKKAMVFHVKKGEYPMVDQDMTVVLPNHEAIVRYENIDLTDIHRLKVIIGVAPNYFSGGTMEVFIDDENGTKIGSADFAVGLTTMGIKDLVVDLNNVSGRHDLLLKFSCKDTTKMFGAITAIEFLRKP
jgi:cytochrome c